MTRQDFSELLLDYCLAFSASETSGFRTIDHNRNVGGVVGSPHCSGLGRDVQYDGARPGPEADRWLAIRGLRRLDERTHDHIQPTDWKNRSPLP